MKPKQIERIENMVFKMDELTRWTKVGPFPNEEQAELWSQVKSDLEALSRSLQAWRHAAEEESA